MTGPNLVSHYPPFYFRLIQYLYGRIFSYRMWHTNRGCCSDKIGVVTMDKKQSVDGGFNVKLLHLGLFIFKKQIITFNI